MRRSGRDFRNDEDMNFLELKNIPLSVADRFSFISSVIGWFPIKERKSRYSIYSSDKITETITFNMSQNIGGYSKVRFSAKIASFSKFSSNLSVKFGTKCL